MIFRKNSDFRGKIRILEREKLNFEKNSDFQEELRFSGKYQIFEEKKNSDFQQFFTQKSSDLSTFDDFPQCTMR